jgi:hypothetical protein
MTKKTFPQRREDGSVAVAARFSLQEKEARTALESYVSRWSSSYFAEHGIQPLGELSVEPQVMGLDAVTVDVVFNARPESRLWKDLFLDLVQHVPQGQVTFLGFFDVVAQKMHPGSLP